MSLEHTLSKLIRFRTISDDQETVADAFQWIKDQLQPVPVFIREYEHNGFKSMVITTKKNEKTPKVWLAAHIDVVHGSDRMFQPWVEDGKLYGRGAFDMKFAVACYIEFLKELGMKAREYDFGIMITSDEEFSGSSDGNGTESLFHQEGFSSDVVFLPDGGGVWEFEEAAKEGWLVKVTARGRSAHGGRPWNGENAIRTLNEFLIELYKEFDAVWEENEEHWHPTLNVGNISGGNAVNQVADHAEALLDMRFPTAKERMQFEAIIAKLVEKYKTIEIESLTIFPAHNISRKNGEAKLFADIARKKFGIECGWTKAHGASDARFIGPLGIPVLLIWPDAAGAHSEHEHVDLNDLARYYEVMKEWVKQSTHRETLLASPEKTVEVAA